MEKFQNIRYLKNARRIGTQFQISSVKTVHKYVSRLYIVNQTWYTCNIFIDVLLHVMVIYKKNVVIL